MSNETQLESVSFLDGQRWDLDRTSLLFVAKVGSKSILCVLPFVALMDGYSGDACFQTRDRRKATEDIYARHQEAIHAECRELIQAGHVDCNGELVIRSLA